jgi:hypothetical protein
MNVRDSIEVGTTKNEQENSEIPFPHVQKIFYKPTI